MRDRCSRDKGARKVGVQPRGAYVLTTAGSRYKAASSTNTSARSSSRAFFEYRPAFFPPRLNSRFIPLRRLDFRFLWCPLQLLEDAACVRWMILHFELLLNDLGDTGAGPHLSLETVRLWTTCQQFREFLALLLRQFGSGAFCRTGTQGLLAACSCFTQPLAHRTLAHPECFGDAVALPALLMQFVGLEAPVLLPVLNLLAHTSSVKRFIRLCKSQ